MKSDLMNTSTPTDGDGVDLDALLMGLVDGNPSDPVNGDAILAELMYGIDKDSVDLDALLAELADGDANTGDAQQA